ncbi:MAG: NUDIX domain-containing protein [bacterium]|nr:NUDIX domain-containing protein [bacterium]
MKVGTICFPVQGGNIFLANKKRGFGAGFLNGYGGKQQPEDPTIVEAAIREMKEEGGIVASPEDLEKVAVINFFEEDVQIFECHVFFCRTWQGEFHETDEMDAPQLYNMLDLPYNRMWDADKVWLPIVCSGEKIRATSKYNQGMTRQENFEYEPLQRRGF